MQITITLDTENASDVQSLKAFAESLGGSAKTDYQAKGLSPEQAEEKTASRPARKAAAAPVKAPEPEPEDEPAADGEPTMEDAVALATQMVSDGKAADVKATLTDLGVKRVSELAAGDIRAFISALAG